MGKGERGEGGREEKEGERGEEMVKKWRKRRETVWGERRMREQRMGTGPNYSGSIVYTQTCLQCIPCSEVELDLGLGVEGEGGVEKEGHLFREVAKVVSQGGEVEL